jgi:hypothetical protein
MTHVTRHAAGGRLRVLSLSLLVVAGCGGHRPPASGARPAATEQRFASPNAAVDALLAACRTHDEAALLAIFGADAATVVSTGDATRDRERCARLVGAAQQMTRLDPKGQDTLELVVGHDDFPFPIPLVWDGAGWRFDTEQGAQEILRRRVGADELEAITVCRAYDRTRRSPPSPWWGYTFRVVPGSGALVASPMAYGASGIMTFIGTGGRVYQKDLGSETAEAAAALNASQPDGTWTLVTD